MIYLILGLKHETLQLDNPCLLRDFFLPMPLTPNPCVLRGFLLPNAADFITGLSLLLTAGDLL